MYKSDYSKNNHCNCGKLITNKSIRCRSCASKEIYKNIKPASYIDGRSTQKRYCIDCKKLLTGHSIYLRCRICATKFQIKTKGSPFKGYEDYWKGKQNSQHSEWMKGKNNPMWNNGSSKFPYPFIFNDELKESIRKRDNYTCQNPECNMTEEEHLTVYGQVLHVHHIDYNKQNCKKDNLITLCQQCNLRANKNRYYWQKIYMNKLRGADVVPYQNNVDVSGNSKREPLHLTF
jgi:hypothetical protein